MGELTGVNDFDAVQQRGAQILGAAETFSNNIATLNGNISSHESGQPWGPDKFGDKFKQTYFGPSKGQLHGRQQLSKDEDSDGGGTGNTDTRDGASTIAQKGVTIGEAITGGMGDLQLAEIENTDQIKNAAKPI